MSGNFEQTKEELQRTVREVIRVVVHRRWAFLIPFCLGASAVFISSHRLPREYRAQTVFERRNPIPISKVLERSGPVSMDDIHDSMRYDILGEDAMTSVAERLGLGGEVPDDPSAAARRAESLRAQGNRLRGMLDYRALKTSPELDRIQISARGSDPDEVVQLVNSVRDNYFEHSRERFLGRLRDARGFYVEEIDAVMKSIYLHECELDELQAKFPYVNPATSRAAVNDASTAERDKKQLAGKIEEYRRRISRLSTQLEHLPVPQLLEAEALSFNIDFLDSRADMERERRRLQQYIMKIESEITTHKLEDGMLEPHPQMQKLKTKKTQASRDLAALDAKLGVVADDADTSFSSDPAVVALQRSERQRIMGEIADSRAALEVAEEQMKNVIASLQAHDALRSKSADKRSLYDERMMSLEHERATLEGLQEDERRLARVLEIDAKDQGIKFITIEDASTSRRPVSPKSKAITMLALGVGLAFGACVVFLREFFDHTFHTASAVSTSLGVTVLEGIDEILLPADRRGALVRRLLMVPVACLFLGALLTTAGLAYMSLEHPQRFNHIVEKANRTWQELQL